MKKLIPVLLALLLMLGMLPVSVFAEEPVIYSEAIEFNESTSAESKYFKLTTHRVDGEGWWGDPLTIEAKEGSVTVIRRIEAKVTWFPACFENAYIDHGYPYPRGKVQRGDTVYFEDINATSVTIGNEYSIVYNDIVVYYTYDANGHSYDENNVCVNCGVTKCSVEGHPYEKGVCTRCGHACENKFHNGVYVCDECGMTFDPTAGDPFLAGSAFSGGSLTVIVGAACAVVFGLGGFLLGRKKKKSTE